MRRRRWKKDKENVPRRNAAGGRSQTVRPCFPQVSIRSGKTSAQPLQSGFRTFLFGTAGEDIARRLRALDLNTTTPLEALNLLYEMKKDLG